MKISLICTVLNEGRSIHNLLDSIAQQTRPPDEIVFVDGGSTDDTVARLQAFAAQMSMPVQVIVEPGANISRGRNIAIQAATHPFIASTDAGVRLSPNWLESLLAPFQDDPSLKVVCGFFIADPQTAFEVAMGATVLPNLSDINPATFLPSSRSVAFCKESWAAIGGYPEWLDYCEDLIFDIRLKETGAPFGFAPDAVAYFRPRGNLRAFFKQYYRYARGDGKADLWRKRHAIRYITYLFVVPLVTALGAAVHPWLWGLALLGGAVYLRGPYRRLPRVMRAFATTHPMGVGGWLYAIALVPVIRVVGDIAKMVGYPVGLRWRQKASPPAWRQIRVE